MPRRPTVAELEAVIADIESGRCKIRGKRKGDVIARLEGRLEEARARVKRPNTPALVTASVRQRQERERMARFMAREARRL